MFPDGPRRDLIATVTNEGMFRWRLVVYGEDLGIVGTVTEAYSTAEAQVGEPLRWRRNGDRYEAWSH